MWDKPKEKKPIRLATKIILGVLALLAVLVLFFTTYGVPIRINTTAIEINISSLDYFGCYVERTVEIRGRYIIGLFGRDHEFIGHIRISGYPETYYNTMDSLQFYTRDFASNNFRVSMLRYYEYFGQQLPSFFGMVYARSFFFEPWIISTNAGRDILASPIIIPGATSFKEGFEIALWFLTFAEE